MRLKKKQKEAVIQWAAEGLESGEINKRAAKFKPPFSVSRAQVDYYRGSRKKKLQELRESGEHNALTAGLSVKANRVDTLQKLADKIISDLLDDGKLWLTQVKGIGGQLNYERIEYEEFNKAEVDALRGLLDDIASELGERAPGVQVNNTYNFDMEKWKADRTERLNKIKNLEEN